ncbi:hypothetical protein E1A91_D06G182500v1 [Gossypium mustelinum]|uniref:Uncharacterized protein n=1 Tax=Gossypium mustelinum TaxID=34275 RepID=A0A5D2UL48_GOSMU|nr:hypothetical protein E1A91_D06G182500v1 [Gossypium mustelinum]
MLIHVLRSSYLDLTLKIGFWLLKHSIMFVDYQYSIRKECIVCCKPPILTWLSD